MTNIHNMKLNDEPFNLIKNKTKTIELRLYDEKRKLLKENDIIEFTNISTLEKLKVTIEKIYKYNSFDELYNDFDKISLGYSNDDIANPSDMEKYYPKEKQKKYGVIGIKIRVID